MCALPAFSEVAVGEIAEGHIGKRGKKRKMLLFLIYLLLDLGFL